MDILRIAPYRSCTFQASSWDDFFRGAASCWRNPIAFSALSSPHFVAIALFSYWTLLIVLQTVLGGKRASFSNSRPFVFVAGLHNGLLSAASLLMCLGVSFELFKTMKVGGGVRATLCTPVGERMPPGLEALLYVFYLTKFWEFFDTVLLVLRGRPITLLHLWHHSSVAIETRAWLDYGMTLGAYGMWFNSFIHTFMYAYYCCALVKVKFPFKKMITVTQIVQFLTSFVFVIPFARFSGTDNACTGLKGVYISVLFNASYLVLFLRFYASAYSSPKKPKVS